MKASAEEIASLRAKIWNGSLPLEIRLAASDCRTYDQSDPYLIQYPRLSYLAFMLPRLHAYFVPVLINPDVSPHEAWLSFEEVPLKWHYPLGLLYDLFSGAEPANLGRQQLEEDDNVAEATVEMSTGVTPIPWRLTIHYTEFPDDHLIQLDPDGRTMQDTFINSIKEADFVRNGTARTVMSLSKVDSDKLWSSVVAHDLSQFNTVNSKLLSPPGIVLRHVPVKIYLPTSASQAGSDAIPEEGRPGHLRVVQSLVPLALSSKQPQTVGTALNGVLPTLFPSKRNPLLALPVLHGAVVPMAAHIDDLGKAAAYTDGFLHLAIVMLG